MRRTRSRHDEQELGGPGSQKYSIVSSWSSRLLGTVYTSFGRLLSYRHSALITSSAFVASLALVGTGSASASTGRDMRCVSVGGWRLLCNLAFARRAKLLNQQLQEGLAGLVGTNPRKLVDRIPHATFVMGRGEAVEAACKLLLCWNIHVFKLVQSVNHHDMKVSQVARSAFVAFALGAPAAFRILLVAGLDSLREMHALGAWR
ncbi:hypothetical protein IWZ03DRAFT_142033 [Phyllosticta citriasiana]|uniref:Uncharacterized protein n=1 Tax=Phyllosticta citriasiana TaxID=595635 RepID=A0ABR1KXF4_9PEZI